jgi:hypothetical protein
VLQQQTLVVPCSMDQASAAFAFIASPIDHEVPAAQGCLHGDKWANDRQSC